MDLLTRLKADFIFTHQMDYFTEKEIMRVIDMAYCVEISDIYRDKTKSLYKKVNMVHNGKVVETYKSITDAACKNAIPRTTLNDAISNLFNLIILLNKIRLSMLLSFSTKKY